jgi:plastocyanin
MKTIFTFKNRLHLATGLTLAFLFFGLNTYATIHRVNVMNFKFDPKEITITAGDTVIWTNNNGNHNVNGQKSVYPSNPESFGNSLGSNWTYQFIFNTAGVYNYQCDPHVGMGMVGKVTVTQNQTTDIQLAEIANKIKVFPNPANEFINLEIPTSLGSARSLKIYSITGTLVDSRVMSGNSYRYDLKSLKNGVYFVEIQTSARKEVLKFIKQ